MLKVKTLVIALLALTACRPKLAPTVVLHLVDPARWSAEDRRMVASVGSVWSALKLAWRVTDDPARGTNPCPSDWYARNDLTCTIDVGLIKEDDMKARRSALGQSDRATGESWIDSALRGYLLLHVLAHEVGHQVLDTWEHLTVPGIMQQGAADWQASPADLKLACKTIRRGC